MIKSINQFTVLLLLCLIACKKNKDLQQPEETDPPVSPVAVIDAVSIKLMNADSLSAFIKALKVTVLKEEEVKTGITIFAPINSCFGESINDNGVFPDESTPKDYIVKGVVEIQNIRDEEKLISLTGKELTVTKKDNQVFINGILITGNVANVEASNFSVYSVSGININNSGSNYKDPHANEYYIAYIQNGQSKRVSGGKLSPWRTYLNYQTFPLINACINKDDYDGPSVTYEFQSSNNIPFSLLIPRVNGITPPQTGVYQNGVAFYDPIFNRSSGNCNLTIDNATYYCSEKDSYVKVTIAEVKIEKNTSTEIRGYYRGTFEAILYYTPYFGAEKQKIVITGGGFMAPLGGDAIILGQSVSNDQVKLITAHPWKISKYTITPPIDWNDDGVLDPDLWPLEPGCSKDNFLTFKLDNTYENNAGATKCFPEEEQIYKASWSFSDDGTRIIITEDDETINYFIIELTSTLLKFNRTDQDEDGVTYTSEWTLIPY